MQARAIPGAEALLSLMVPLCLQNDPLSAGWQRENGGNFSNGIATLSTDHLSLYFVGITQINGSSIYDEAEEEVLDCPENEIELSVSAPPPPSPPFAPFSVMIPPRCHPPPPPPSAKRPS